MTPQAIHSWHAFRRKASGSLAAAEAIPQTPNSRRWQASQDARPQASAPERRDGVAAAASRQRLDAGSPHEPQPLKQFHRFHGCQAPRPYE